jgi:CHAT domain
MMARGPAAVAIVLVASVAFRALAACVRGPPATPPPSVQVRAAPLRDLQGCLLRSWAPTVAGARQPPLPTERDLQVVAERARSGRFREAERILDGMDGSSDALVRLESLLFRAELEDFRLAYVGGGSGTGEARIDAVRHLAARRRANERINSILAKLPAADQREANLAVQLENTMSLAADLPAFSGFQVDHAGLSANAETDTESFRANLDATVARLRATPGVHPGLDEWYIPVRARIDGALGDSRAAIAALSGALRSSHDPRVRAELHVRLGDALAAPFGPVEMLGQNPLSIDDALVAMRSSILTRSLVAPSSDARQRAAAEYDAAASDGGAAFRWRLREREGYLKSLDDPRGAAAVYGSAAELAAAAGAARDALRLETIAALVARDPAGIARAADGWARSDDVGGRRSMVALARWYTAWLADSGRDLSSARRLLEAMNDAFTAAHLDVEVIGVRQLLGVIEGNMGLLDAATRFDETAAAAQRTVLTDAEQVQREIPDTDSQVQIANSDLAVLLQSLANRMGLLGISDGSEALRSRQHALQQELEARWGHTGFAEAIRNSQKALVDQMRAIADRRRQIENVRTCGQRAALLTGSIAAASGLDRAELLVMVAACRADWVEQARGILDRLDPINPFEAALSRRDPRAAFVSRNDVDNAGIDLERAFRAAAAAGDWRTLGRWAARLEALSGDDHSLQAYRRYASLYRSVVQLNTGAVPDALRRLEALRAEGLVAADPEVELGVYYGLVQAYVAEGDALRGLSAEARLRMRRREIDELAKGLRPGDPSGAEQAALERKYALSGSLGDSESKRLDDLRRAARAAADVDPRYPSTSDVSSFVDRLADRTVVEVIDISGREAIVWCARRGSLRSLRLARGGDYWAAEIGAYWASLVNDEADRVARGRNLFDGMLNSCALSDGEGLIVVGARGPFEHAIEPNGEVIERRTVVHGEELWEPPPLRAPNENGAFVIGVNSNGLRFAEAEANDIADMLGVVPARASAVAPGALLAALEAARYVHIAADGHVDPDNPYASTLSLGGDRAIEAWELFRHSAGAYLVTLSACDTAALPTRTRGYSFATLAHLAGARWVLATQWNVDDLTTDRFMRDFYRLVVSGRASVPDAFRTAKLRAKAAHEAQPSFYAPYFLSVRSVVAGGN